MPPAALLLDLDGTLTREEIIPKIGRALPTLYAQEHDSWVRLYDGVEEMLATLHGQLPLALVTSKSLQPECRPAPPSGGPPSQRPCGLWRTRASTHPVRSLALG